MNRYTYIGTVVLLLLAAGCAGTPETTVDTADDASEWITLFDGDDLTGWEMAGPGAFVLAGDGTMASEGGMGLFYYTERPFRDFVLELDWKASSDSANSGIFVRFPEQTTDPWYAVRAGYEIQIHDAGDPTHGTGAVYDFSGHWKQAARPAGEWNTYRIEVTGQRYQIYLNGEKVNDFFGERGREGYIGVQNHDEHSKVWFRNIRVKPLPDGGPESLAELFAVEETVEPIRVLMVTATHGFRHTDAIATAKQLFKDLEATTEFRVDTTEDVSVFTPENLARYDLLFFNNSTLRVRREAGPAAAATAWATYDVTLQTPDGNMNGTIVLTGTPDALAGTIVFPSAYPDPAPLRDVRLGGEQLTFNFEGGEYGTIEGRATLRDDRFDGTLTVTGHPVPLHGTKAATPEAGTAPEEPEILVTEAQRRAIMDFLAAGKGVVVAHAGLDAFYGWNEYRAMVGGGLFKEHPWTRPVRIAIEEKDNPAVEHFGDGFWLRDEIYVLDENPRWNSRVLASLDMESVGVEQGPADFSRNDYPISWMRTHNGGRVFVTKLGHFADVWTTPDFLRHMLQGMRMAAGRIPADFSGHRVKEVIAEGVWPDDIAVDERGNVWIAELRGKVHRYDAGTGQTNQIAHIQTTDPTKIEHGLYGIEVDPDFYRGAPYVYLYYAEPETFINTLARFEYRDGRLDEASRQVLLRVPTEPHCCHQAGDLEWGPDSTLYLSTGDTGMSEVRPDWELTEAEIEAFKARHNLAEIHWSRLVDSERSAQNLADLRGKILRINRDGSIPRDNPFFGQPGVRWEIFAYGLRNPYRFKIDPETGRLFVGVVGPDAVYDYDEYNQGTGGEDYGWPRTLGRLFYNEWRPEMMPAFSPPMWEYTYESGGRSATVGPIYRYDGPGAFPPAFRDKVFVFDWSRRWIKWADVEEGTFTNDAANDVKNDTLRVSMPALRLTNIKTFDLLTTTTPISMEVGPDGALYVAEFDGFWDAGPNARVTRYRWVTGDAGTAAPASPSGSR